MFLPKIRRILRWRGCKTFCTSMNRLVLVVVHLLYWALSIRTQGSVPKANESFHSFGLSMLVYFSHTQTIRSNKFSSAPSYSSAWLFGRVGGREWKREESPQRSESKFKCSISHDGCTKLRNSHTLNIFVPCACACACACVRALTARSICGLVLIRPLNSPCECKKFFFFENSLRWIAMVCSKTNGVC